MEDEEKMIAFYTSVLQLAHERLQEYRDGAVPFPSVRLNPDTIIALFPKRMWQKNSPNGSGLEHLNHFCMAMDQETWNELLERLTFTRDEHGWRVSFNNDEHIDIPDALVSGG